MSRHNKSNSNIAELFQHFIQIKNRGKAASILSWDLNFHTETVKESPPSQNECVSKM